MTQGGGSKPMSAASRIDSAKDKLRRQSPGKVMFIGAQRGSDDIPSFAADEPSGRSEGPRLVKQQTRRASVTAFELSRMASRMPTDLDIDSEEDIDGNLPPDAPTPTPSLPLPPPRAQCCPVETADYRTQKVLESIADHAADSPTVLLQIPAARRRRRREQGVPCIQARHPSSASDPSSHGAHEEAQECLFGDLHP